MISQSIRIGGNLNVNVFTYLNKYKKCNYNIY